MAVSADWLDSGFPACLFNKSQSSDWLLWEIQLYTLTKCQPVPVEAVDTGQYSAFVYPAFVKLPFCNTQVFFFYELGPIFLWSFMSSFFLFLLMDFCSPLNGCVGRQGGFYRSTTRAHMCIKFPVTVGPAAMAVHWNSGWIPSSFACVVLGVVSFPCWGNFPICITMVSGYSGAMTESWRTGQRATEHVRDKPTLLT